MSLFLAPNKRRNQNPAPLDITGAVSNGVDWVETVVITDQDGSQVTGVGSDEWQLQLRSDPCLSAPDLTATTSSELSITVASSTTYLAINLSASRMGALTPGLYTIDIASETSGDVATQRAHGEISVLGYPISF